VIYRIRDWDSNFENNRTRNRPKLGWVPVPNKHDGEGFRRIMAEADGIVIYGCWHLILQVASKCAPRGTLVRYDGTPLQAADIALRTGWRKEKDVQRALEFCSSPEVGWLEIVAYPWHDGDTPLATECAQGALKERIEENRREENRREEKEPDAASAAVSCPHQEIIQAYHEECRALPAVKTWNGSGRTALATRWKEEPERQSVDWWRAFFRDQVATSDFLMGRATDFRATLNWLVGPKNFEKVLNGQYVNRSAAASVASYESPLEKYRRERDSKNGSK